MSPSCAYPLVVQGKLGTRYLVTVPEMELVLSYWGPEFVSPLDLKHVRGPRLGQSSCVEQSVPDVSRAAGAAIVRLYIKHQ